MCILVFIKTLNVTSLGWNLRKYIKDSLTLIVFINYTSFVKVNKPAINQNALIAKVL